MRPMNRISLLKSLDVSSGIARGHFGRKNSNKRRKKCTAREINLRDLRGFSLLSEEKEALTPAVLMG
jgi:hypothetical protein